MHHSFDISIAEKYGVNIAIFLSNMAFWIKKNQANHKHFHEGRYWTYNTIQAYSVLFPYWSLKQMRLVLDKLKESSLVITGNFNATLYDRTQWYALSDLGHKIVGLPICPDRQIEVEKKANGFAQKDQPIPDINTDIKPDKRKERGKKRCKAPAHTEIPVYFTPTDNHMLLCAQLGVDVEKEKNAFIDYYQAHGKKMVNWNAAFNNWLRKSAEFEEKSGRKEHPITKTINELKEQSPEFRQFLLS